MSVKKLFSIRGATCAENTGESITKNVGELCNLLFKENNLSTEDIVNIQFTVTPDLDALNPATAFRRAKDIELDVSVVPLFCSQEPVIEGMLPKVVRIMITSYMDENSSVKTKYINGAQALRPDLAK